MARSLCWAARLRCHVAVPPRSQIPPAELQMPAQLARVGQLAWCRGTSKVFKAATLHKAGPYRVLAVKSGHERVLVVTPECTVMNRAASLQVP